MHLLLVVLWYAWKTFLVWLHIQRNRCQSYKEFRRKSTFLFLYVLRNWFILLDHFRSDKTLTIKSVMSYYMKYLHYGRVATHSSHSNECVVCIFKLMHFSYIQHTRNRSMFAIFHFLSLHWPTPGKNGLSWSVNEMND